MFAGRERPAGGCGRSKKVLWIRGNEFSPARDQSKTAPLRTKSVGMNEPSICIFQSQLPVEQCIIRNFPMSPSTDVLTPRRHRHAQARTCQMTQNENHPCPKYSIYKASNATMPSCKPPSLLPLIPPSLYTPPPPLPRPYPLYRNFTG